MANPFQLLLEARNRSGIRHMVGGSLASSVRGVHRSTNDIDVIADIRKPHIPNFVLHLEGAFYADPETMREAVRRGQSFIRAEQAESLDSKHMQQWARELKVDDLFERLFSEELPL